jgi:hypothetical protein
LHKVPMMRINTTETVATLLLAFLTAHGCGTQPPGAPLALMERAWAEPTWGPPNEGLQCRLRAVRRTWQPGEIPVFKANIRNHGKRTFPFLTAHQQQLCAVEFDGTWHHWPAPVVIDSAVWHLEPGTQLDDITISLHEKLQIDVTAGRHIVRAAFTLEGVRVVSNPVGIEALPRHGR